MQSPALNFNQEFHKHTFYETYGEKIKLNILVDFVRKNHIHKIVDVGCHTGSVSLPLAYLGTDVTAIDVDTNIIEEAAKRDTRHTVKWSHEDFKNLTGKYDTVLLLDVLEHTANAAEYINKAFDLLEDGGWVVLSIPNGFGPFEIFWDIPIQKIRKFLHREMKLGDIHLQFFTINKIKELIKNKFEIYSAESFMFLNLLPVLNKSLCISVIDYLFARKLPLAVTSRWLIVLKKL